MRKVHWIARSKDKKTGEVVASYSPKSTCPDTCSLKTGGCYAWGLFYMNILSSKIEKGAIKLGTLKDALSRRSVSCKVVRHRIAGDVVSDVDATIEECKEVEKAGLINIGYTHHWRAPEAQPLKKYFRASCQNEVELEEARQMGWSTTLIVNDAPSKRMQLSNGETGYLCPARAGVEGKKDITCNTCTLCKVNDTTRDKTVLFKVHGNNATLKKLKGKIT